MPEQNIDTKNFSKYVDPTGEFATRDLKLAELYLHHKLQLEHVGIGALILFCVATIGFSGWKWGEYLLVGYAEDKRLLVEQQMLFQNYEEMQNMYAAEDVSVGSAQVFRSSPGKYDFAAIVSNPNKRHVALLRYKFVFQSSETSVEEALILPGIRRPILALGVPMTAAPGSVRLVIVGEKYQRVDPHRVHDVAAYTGERLRFSVGSFVFADGHAGFDLSNDSAYSYWQPVFYVELLSGSQLVSVSSFTADQFRAGEKRMIDLRVLGDIRSVSEIRVTPIINIFSPSVFIAPGA